MAAGLRAEPSGEALAFLLRPLPGAVTVPARLLELLLPVLVRAGRALGLLPLAALPALSPPPVRRQVYAGSRPRKRSLRPKQFPTKTRSGWCWWCSAQETPI